MIYAFVPRADRTAETCDEAQDIDRQETPLMSDEEIQQKVRERKFREICSQMVDTYHKKNLDYGNAFGKSYEDFGLIAAVVRLGDKYRRIRSLCERENMVKDESIKDTLLDLANYSIMTLIEMEKNQ